MAFRLVIVLLLAGATQAAGIDRKDVVGIDAAPGGLQVIDAKCLDCHNRQRIEEAARKRKEVEQVLKRMEQKGAVLTPKEHEVIGHFWQQSPFKSK